MTSTPNPPPATRGDLAFLGLFAAIKLLLHLPILGRYGYHHDELYFLACGQHLSFGYVDHAPLVPWIARLADELFGQSVYGLRIFATLAGAAAVYLTGLLTRRLGGGRFAQTVACLSMLIAPVYLRTGNMLTIPSFEVLFWILGSYLVVRIVQEENPQLWLWVGLVAGAGLLNKHSMAFFGLGLVAALALTPERKHFKSPWLYLGGAVALLVFAPNLVWQMSNSWPTAQFLLALNEGTMSGISVLQFVAGQLLYLNLFAAAVWIAGLWHFFSTPGERYRVLGWIWVTVFVLLIVIKSKIYYLAPAYPALLAGGGLAFERLVERGRAWLRPAATWGLVAGGLVFLPISLPFLSINALERYVTTVTFGAFENVYELTGDLRGMFGWPERVQAVAEVYDRLPPEERERAVILASSYGKAGAIDYFGGAHGLPKATSVHMTYHLWGLPEGPIETLIAVGIPPDQLEKLYEEVTVEARLELENVNPWDREFEVAVCRRPKVDLHEIWAKNRRW